MGSIRVSTRGKLFFDFYYGNERCREYTLLKDTAGNRRLMERTLRKIEKAIQAGSFRYIDYFPNSKRAHSFASSEPPPVMPVSPSENGPTGDGRSSPSFVKFSDQWYSEREVDWKRSTQTKNLDILSKHLVPRFRGMRVGDITKADILSFRAHLAKDYREGQGLSPARVNQILNVLSQILGEAADRFHFTTPYRGIKPLRVPKTQIDPFTLEEVRCFLDTVPESYRYYYTVAFFTGMRTSELLGLKWRNLDFDRGEILVRDTIVHCRADTTKNDGSDRVIDMSTTVSGALKSQLDSRHAQSEYVFCTRNGQPLNYRNMARRVWYPTLETAGLRRRRPYQTRHTAATLWLASGGNPEWVARQMGHTTTKMLFTIYSRFVPNLTRRDGSAMEQLLKNQFGGDQ